MLIRQYIPRDDNFSKLTDEQVAEIQYKINRRPRKNGLPHPVSRILSIFAIVSCVLVWNLYFRKILSFFLWNKKNVVILHPILNGIIINTFANEAYRIV